MVRNNPSNALRLIKGTMIRASACCCSISATRAANFNSITNTSVTTAIGPLRGSFMIVNVRSRSPNPPSQASALSARPSRCSAPLSSTHTASNTAA
ncbi:hypothetical protein D3C85_1612110 [compost metagenome]